jgi:hypothetical protein
MDTTLLAQFTGNTWQRIDVFEDIPITLTIQQSDLTDLTARRIPYSKTIQIPDTANNAILFEHYYEINGTEFNPLQKIPIIVQYRGTDIFQGVMRLNSVTTNSEERLYDIFLLGEVSDFLAPIRNLQLQDLDYTDLNHNLVYSSITKSWECVNDGNSGLFDGQILYPLINYGLDYQGGSTTAATPTFTYDFGGDYSFDQSTYPVTASMFKPAIQLKSVLDRIFSKTGYEVKSDFFDSEYFTSIYMDTFQNGKVGIEYASGVTNQNIFRAFGNASRVQVFDYDKDTHHEIQFLDQINGGYDPLNNYSPAGGNTFAVPYAGLYGFNTRFNLSTQDFCIFTAILVPDITIQAWKGTDPNTILTTGTMFYESPPIKLSQAFTGIGGSGPLPVNLFFSDTLNAGEFVRIFIFDKTTFANPFCFSQNKGNYEILGYDDGVIIDRLPMYDLYQSPTIITELVDLRLGIANIECVNFIKSLITMFNLTIEQDEQRKVITMEPYNWRYDDNSRGVKDWTKILDLNSNVKVEPLSFDLPKDNVWTYAFTDFEYLPKLWTDQYDFVYGRQRITTESNIFVGENVYEVPFGSCPTSGVTNAPNFIIPQFYYLNNQQQAPYATKPHLFFWVGNRLAYKDALRTDQGSWYLLSGSTPIEWTTYPAVSHLSILESQLPEVISDLNFRGTFDFFGNTTNQIQQFTPFTIYDSFWKTYIENLYDPTNKRMIGDFYFKPIDVYETKLSDKIWIKDSFFSIEKISDADLVNKRLTEISLIKENQPYYKIEPPAPIYIYTPNQGYPSPEPFWYDLAYVSTDKDLVCNGTTPSLTTIYSFGTGVLENLDVVFIDTGISYQILPMGTYVRQNGYTTTFVVADIYGRVLETTC